MPRGKKASGITPGRRRAYEALKSKFGKTRAAKIANAGKDKTDRRAMGRKAARTRKNT